MDTRITERVMSVAASGAPKLRVGVLVDLPLGAASGGHVRCWERLAEAARDFPGELDLTVHFMGSKSDRIELSGNVRYSIEPPVFPTHRLPFLSHVPDHTDLSPWHPALARRLADYDVIHTTDAYFAYARTALRVGRRHDIPVVNSVHTNTPEYTRLFTAQTVERLFGKTVASHFLLSRFDVAQRMERRMLRQLADYQRRCDFVLVSRPEQVPVVGAILGARVGLLRRGVDLRMFHPARRDRNWLFQQYGVPPERLVILAAGRLNRGKNILLLIDAVERLLRRGVDAHLVCAGDGAERTTVIERLGSRTSCPGYVEAAELAKLYASADIFALPSLIEESANVMNEAIASGLPVLVAKESGMGRSVRDQETGLVLPGTDPAAWADALTELARHPSIRPKMASAARDYAESALPSWRDVLAQDLLPHWVEAARQRAISV